jgi:hypothetical protein
VKQKSRRQFAASRNFNKGSVSMGAADRTKTIAPCEAMKPDQAGEMQWLHMFQKISGV